MILKYRETTLNKKSRQRLDVVNDIIQEYQSDGYVLTLRQLYYQLVSRDIIPNRTNEYAKLSILLKEGRMAGIVDWDAIEDRMRKPPTPNMFNDTDDAMETIIAAYALPRMRGQENYIEVWVEKDALSGVLSRVTRKYHIPICVNRGYSSASAMHDAYNRINNALDEHSNAYIIYLGDFDPSGQDMIRDIRDRIKEFNHSMTLTVIPLALTKAQIKEYDPPPNPAKITDTRAAKYIEHHGEYSWEVDALPPKVLNEMLTREIHHLIDLRKYKKILEQENIDKLKLEQGKLFVRQLELKDEEE